jgi:broad specificity phosphatase PhoE
VRAAQPSPTPPLIPSPLLREQHFGIAEGQTWTYRDPGLTLEEEIAQGRYPVLLTNSEKFPGGESRDDLAQRVEEALTKILLPYAWKAAREGNHGVHIAVVSHGLSIHQLVSVLVRKGTQEPGHFSPGIVNTGWCRVNVTVKVRSQFDDRER